MKGGEEGREKREGVDREGRGCGAMCSVISANHATLVSALRNSL